MIVGCGECGRQFEVSGPGRVACPACGTPNQVGGGAAPAGAPGGAPRPAPEPAGPPPQRVTCPACEFSFLVGEVASAPCPNCRETVSVEEA
jgi:hypothetical protein